MKATVRRGLRPLPSWRCLALVCLTAYLAAAMGADWPKFRGPGGLGTSDETEIPTHWNDRKGIVWKCDLPGFGASSPVTVGERVFVTCYSGYGLGQNGGNLQNLKRHLVCVRRGDGEIDWTREIETAMPEQVYGGQFLTLHGYASSTPATDGRRLYVFCGKSGVFAFELDGSPVWHTSVGEGTHDWGSGTSPVPYKNLVIVNASVESGSLVALHKDDGHEVWRAGGMKRAWNTPLVVELPGGDELVVSVERRLLGFDPAKGGERWNCPGIDDYVCPSVVAHEGVVYAIGGRGKPGLAVRAGGRGAVQPLWRTPKGSNVSSPVYHEGHIYFASENQGIVFCIDAETGKEVYGQRLTPKPDRIYASPVLADGKIYYVSRDHGTYVVAAQPKFKLLAHNVIKGDSSAFNASPAVSDGRLFLRSDLQLYCIGAK
ncbi:MAG TPA: PQQ-binding-like beta-propeller repeat protein [Pirellulales bacterium]|nr:PQQ-binding-like beta-propeller repeat protein [Pirellulales bacterium]